MVLNSGEVSMDPVEGERGGRSRDLLEPEVRADPPRTTSGSAAATRASAKSSHLSEKEEASHNGVPAPPTSALVERRSSSSVRGGATPRPLLRRPLSLDMTPRRLRASQEPPADRRVLKPPWRSGSVAPPPPARSLTSPGLGAGGWMRRSESTCSVNYSRGDRGGKGQLRPAVSLPHIAKQGGGSPLPASSRPCLLIALRPLNLEQEKQKFFQSDFRYEPQFEYQQPEPRSMLEKYQDGSGLFLQQAVGIMECVLRKFGSYENFEEVTGGAVLPKCQVWAGVRRYLQKEGCVGEVVVRLSDELLSQAVMVVESCRPTLTINLARARQHWLEGMLRHEIEIPLAVSCTAARHQGAIRTRGLLVTSAIFISSVCFLRDALSPRRQQPAAAVEHLGRPEAVRPQTGQPHGGGAGQPAQRVATETALPVACGAAVLHRAPRRQHELHTPLQPHRSVRPGPGRPLGILPESQEGPEGQLPAGLLQQRSGLSGRDSADSSASKVDRLQDVDVSRKGVVRRRGAASPPGGAAADPSPSLHARPGALPAASGSHRGRQRAGRRRAATSAALSVSAASEEDDAPEGCWDSDWVT
ncbi:uncharacterized protein kiaa0895l isoform X1 [Limanda limanda]|uniref:uncharacterized protein kiaa0895l isoform X1 n=1 Tax=Limanda limanda TaxID=27771 RepID=UPI0029C86949|nr:uncharacterized protein kiaa0895l isoform X1 [Limanda limanda]